MTEQQMTEQQIQQRDAAWKEYKTFLEPRDDRALAREAFNEAWRACLRATLTGRDTPT